MSEQDVRDPKTNKLLFTFDAERDIIRVRDRKRGIDATVSLEEYREKPKNTAENPESS